MAGSVALPAWTASLGQKYFHLVEETLRGGGAGCWQGWSSRPPAVSPGGGWNRPFGMPARKGIERRISATVDHRSNDRTVVARPEDG